MLKILPYKNYNAYTYIKNIQFCKRTTVFNLKNKNVNLRFRNLKQNLSSFKTANLKYSLEA